MWKIMQIILLFSLAVMAGSLVHPLLSIGFLLFAKVISMFLSDVRQGYREMYAMKPKRHLQTADGERLEVVLDDEDSETIFDAPKMKESR